MSLLLFNAILNQWFPDRMKITVFLFLCETVSANVIVSRLLRVLKKLFSLRRLADSVWFFVGIKITLIVTKEKTGGFVICFTEKHTNYEYRNVYSIRLTFCVVFGCYRYKYTTFIVIL